MNEVQRNDPPMRVSVVDVQMPFQSMVIFLVKWALAAIPAFIILLVLFSWFLDIVRGR